MSVSAIGQAAAPDSPACPSHLFIVARSKNANIVAYDANRGPAGDLVSSEPVVAYWLLNGEGGAREELNRMERERAYGLELLPSAGPDGYTMAFRASRKRTLSIRTVNGCPVAVVSIGGRDGILRRLFVQSKEGALPKVEYVELFGDDPATGAPMYEKFTPGK